MALRASRWHLVNSKFGLWPLLMLSKNEPTLGMRFVLAQGPDALQCNCLSRPCCRERSGIPAYPRRYDLGYLSSAACQVSPFKNHVARLSRHRPVQYVGLARAHPLRRGHC